MLLLTQERSATLTRLLRRSSFRVEVVDTEVLVPSSAHPECSPPRKAAHCPDQGTAEGPLGLCAPVPHVTPHHTVPCHATFCHLCQHLTSHHALSCHVPSFTGHVILSCTTSHLPRHRARGVSCHTHCVDLSAASVPTFQGALWQVALGRAAFLGGGGGCRPPTGEPCSAAQRCGDSRGGVAELAPPRPRTRGLRLGEGPRLGGRPPAAVCGSLGKVPPLRRTPRCSCHARFHLPPTGGCAPHPHPRGLCWERGSGTRFETAEFLRFSFYSRAVFGIVQHGAVTPFRVTL